MNPANLIDLEGTIVSDPREGACWTRWKAGGRGQARFWLAVSRDLAGEGFDAFLCAIEPKTADEVRRLEHELRVGRTVHLHATARSLMRKDVYDENSPSVIFVAEECSLDGQAVRNAHRIGYGPRKHHEHGKMAAAGEAVQQDELLPVEVSR